MYLVNEDDQLKINKFSLNYFSVRIFEVLKSKILIFCFNFLLIF
jgi:hypothetical protein